MKKTTEMINALLRRPDHLFVDWAMVQARRKKRMLAFVALIWTLAAAGAADQASAAPGRAVLRHTAGDRFNDVMRKANEYAKSLHEGGAPRKVARGATPEIIVRGGEISINKKAVAVGGSMETWKRALHAPVRCDESVRTEICDWDSLGISVRAQNNMVVELTIYFKLRPLGPPDELLPADWPKSVDLRPKTPFPGYFELDGFGIDADTSFWEIQMMSKGRDFSCIRGDCSHANGRFNDIAKLAIVTDHTSENGTIEEFTILRGGLIRLSQVQ